MQLTPGEGCPFSWQPLMACSFFRLRVRSCEIFTVHTRMLDDVTVWLRQPYCWNFTEPYCWNFTVQLLSRIGLTVSVFRPHCQATWPLFKLNHRPSSSVLSPFPPHILLFGGREYFKTILPQVWHHFDFRTLVCISRGQALCLCVHSCAGSHTLLEGNPAPE